MADITAGLIGGPATGVIGKSKSPEAMLPGFLLWRGHFGISEISLTAG
jgi:hypothetical protein